MALKFIYHGGKERVHLAIMAAERILKDGAFHVDIGTKAEWRFNSGTSVEVLAKILKQESPCKVYLYRHWWNPWTRSLGGYKNGVIKINRYKLPYLTHEELVGFLCHEFMHHCGFGHGNNYKTVEKCLYSVPYYVSENIGRWL